LPDLGVQLGTLALKNPVVCASGEHVASYESIVAAIDAGAAAVVAKSANESEAARRQLAGAEYVLLGDDREPVDWAPGFTGSYFNRSGLVDVPWEEWLDELVRADAHAREAGAYVVASLIPGDPARLPELARAVQAAGLRWLELNLSAPHSGEAAPGAIVRAGGAGLVDELVRTVRAAVGIPLSVKLTAEAGDVVALARAAWEAGADHLVLTGRQLGFLPDPATRRPVLGTFGAIGGGWALPLTLRWIAKTRLGLGVDVPLVGTNGARDGTDVARFLLAGASAVQLATSVLLEGFAALDRVLDELGAYLEEQGAAARDLVGEAADAAMTYEEAAAMRSCE
jgi:dihydropyrimidine dehydrogenase (NAD+) subunit PreA/dihydroorotate dehydrogenase (NAD+) catalytic subunit